MLASRSTVHALRSLRILLLVHPELIPPDALDGYSDEEVAAWKTEYDVKTALRDMGHEVAVLGVEDELGDIRERVDQFRPHIVFNLLEELKGRAGYDVYVVGYLEVHGIRYTGCPPRGLLLARDKALSKKLLAYHRVRAPRFATFPRGRRVRRPKGLEFPLIVKSLNEDASWGISEASVVHDDERLSERVEYVHEHVGSGAIAEQFIAGRDIYVGVLGNQRLRVLPPQELVFDKKPPGAKRIATQRAKFDLKYQEKWGIDIVPARDLSSETLERLDKISRRIYKNLGLAGYGRVDFRVDERGVPFFLEANPNPDVARYEELASAADSAGMSYEDLLAKILSLGLRRDRS